MATKCEIERVRMKGENTPDDMSISVSRLNEQEFSVGLKNGKESTYIHVPLHLVQALRDGLNIMINTYDVEFVKKPAVKNPCSGEGDVK